MADKKQKVGGAAGAAVVLSVGSLLLTCTGHPFWSVIAAALSLPAGVIGFLMAASPRVRGGILSLASIALGAIALIIAILAAAGAIVF